MIEMTDERAAEVLAAHNEWRRHDGFPGEPGAPEMGDPTELGRAIDHVVSRLLAQPPDEAQAQGGDEAWLLNPRTVESKAQWDAVARALGADVDDPDAVLAAAKAKQASVPVGVDVDQLREQATAWEAVFDVLEEVAPGWRGGELETTTHKAIQTIRTLAQQPAAVPVGVDDHVKALRELRDTGDVSDWRLLDAALDIAIAALTAQQPTAEIEALRNERDFLVEEYERAVGCGPQGYTHAAMHLFNAIANAQADQNAKVIVELRAEVGRAVEVAQEGARLVAQAASQRDAEKARAERLAEALREAADMLLADYPETAKRLRDTLNPTATQENDDA